MSALSDRPVNPVVGLEIPHESADLHVTGQALYTDDLITRTRGCPARLACPGTACPRAGDAAAHRTGPRGHRGGAGAHRRRRARGERRGSQARRAAVPHRGDVLRPRRLLGARRDDRGGPPRRRARRGRLRAAAVTAHPHRGDRGRVLPGRPAHPAPRGPRRGAGRRGPGRRGRVRVRRPGALLPRDPRLAGARRRGRPGLRAVQHPAPQRDPGDRRPRPRAAQPRGDRAVPAHGRRLRRQGDAAARVCRHRGSGGDPHRPSGAASPQPEPGHHDVGQAPPVPRVVDRRVRRRRPHRGPARDAHLRRRLEPRPVRAGPGPGAVPRRQRLLDPRHRGPGPGRQDPQDLPDRLPRVRRPAGHARHRGHPRPQRPAARPDP